MRLDRNRHWLIGTLGIGLMLMSWAFAPAKAQASCGDYVVYHGSEPMAEHQSAPNASETESEKPSQAPVPRPCPGAGCGPVSPEPATTTAISSVKVERMSCTLESCSDLRSKYARLALIIETIHLSRYSSPIFHPPRSV